MIDINKKADDFVQSLINKSLPFKWYIRIWFEDVRSGKTTSFVIPDGYADAKLAHLDIKDIGERGFMSNEGLYFIPRHVIKFIDVLSKEDLEDGTASIIH